MVVKQREDALGGARMVEALGTFGGGSEQSWQSLGGQFKWVGEHRLRGKGGGRCWKRIKLRKQSVASRSSPRR